MATHLITGGTGTLGHALILDLLERRPQDDFYVVTRPGADTTPRTRLVNRLVRAADLYGKDSLIPAIRTRVHAVQGDIVSSSLRHSIGMPDSVAYVWHLAATHEHRHRHREYIHHTNVIGTQNVLDLVAPLRPTLFVHVSSAYVAGNRRAPAPTDPAHTGNAVCAYTESKIKSEHRVLGETRFPTIIVRPSTLVGHSDLGTYAGNPHGIYRLRDMIVRSVPQGDRLVIAADKAWKMNLIPVDVAARQVADVAHNRRTQQRIFHITNPWPTALPEVFAALSASTGRRVVMTNRMADARVPPPLRIPLGWMLLQCAGCSRFDGRSTTRCSRESPTVGYGDLVHYLTRTPAPPPLVARTERQRVRGGL